MFELRDWIILFLIGGMSSFICIVYIRVSRMYKEMSSMDGLTKVSNRKRLNEIYKNWTKNQTVECYLILINMDKFKEINDKYGCNIGDTILYEVALKLQKLQRDDIFLARFGGDEFVFLIKNEKSKEEIVKLCEKIQRLVADSIVINRKCIPISSSIGVVHFPTDAKEFDEMLSYADAVVKEVKSNGGNGYCFVNQEMKERYNRRDLINRDKEQALIKGQFILMYQPKIEVSTSNLHGVETLVRWNHPLLGLVTPIEFIEIFEETKYIVKLGEWIISEACVQLRKWHQQGHFLHLSINVSPIQFESPQLVKTIQQALIDNEIAGEYVTIEITEQLMLQDLKMVVSTIEQIQSLGVKISLDDFGTGYSSLAYLKSIPLDEIKIAREFLLNQDEKCIRVFLNAIKSLAQHLNVTMVVEGVETAEQVNLLKSLRMDYLQGYYYSKPVLAEELRHFYE